MIDVRAAVYAGVAAGIVSTLAQIGLWLIFSDAFPAILFRDARLTAAIVMGRGVLPPPTSFDWRVMLVATLVHFTLSMLYGLILSCLMSRLATALAAIVGAAFGLILYAVNMYGFTVVFPWFEAARDWITLASHLVFGVVAALVYKVLSRLRGVYAHGAGG
jgi:uncharacterized membrane protein YagU involved in acid resistance